MTFALIIASMIAALAICLTQLRKPSGYMTYPLLVAVFYLAWVGPQILSVLRDPLAPGEGLWAISLMMLLSLIVVVVGWSIGRRQALGALKTGRIAIAGQSADDQLLWPTAALTAVAVAARVVIGGLRLDPDLTNQWSGPIVIAATVAAIRIIPLFLSLVMVLRRRTPLTLGLALVNLLLSGSFAFVDMGRSETIDLGLVCFLALWFARRVRIPLPMLAAGGVAIGIFVFTVGEFRDAARANYELTGERVSAFNPAIWRDIDFETASAEAAEGAPDVRNAVYLMSYRQVMGGYTLGTRFWDDVVFRSVPAQLVGADVKAALMFEKDQQSAYDGILNAYNYKRIGGTTSTGFGIAYTEFWYFGCLLFGLYAWCAGRWWTFGSKGDPWAQLMYAVTLGSGLINFTHNVYWVWLNMPLLLSGVAFIKLWIWAASPRPQAHRPMPRAGRMVEDVA